MVKQAVVKLGQALALIIAGIITVWLLVASWQVKPQVGIGSLALSGGVVILLGLLIGGGSYWLSRRQTSWLVASFIGLTLLKFPLVAWLKIAPVGDFKVYHALAVFNAHGLTWHQMLTHGLIGASIASPTTLNVANLFSFSTALGGTNFFISQLINISCTLLDILLLYWLVSRWLSRRLGIMASLIFYCIPSYWLYSTLLNGAEPLLITCLLVMMLALTRALKPLPTASPNDHWFNLIIAGGATLVANMIQPIMISWLVILALFTVIVILDLGRSYHFQYRHVGLYVVTTAVVLIATTGLSSWLYGFQVTPPTANVSYDVTSGAQTSANQRSQTALVQADPAIAALLATSPTGQLGPVISHRMQSLAREDYGFHWSLVNLRSVQQRRTWKRTQPFWAGLAHIYWQLMLIATLISVVIGGWLWWRPSALNHYFLYATLLLDGLTLTALLIGAQGRSRAILYLPIIFMITCGTAGITQLWSRQRRV